MFPTYPDDEFIDPWEPQPIPPQITPPVSQYSWWSDPDNAPPAWMLNGNQQPTVDPGPGRYWNWAGDHWEARDAPRANPNTTTPPPGSTNPPPPGGPTGGPGGDWGYLTEPFTGRPPSWMSGTPFVPPTFTRPPDFNYRQFEAPTRDSIYADPSYQFRYDEGRRALGAHRASEGTYLTGGTLKDFINYGQNAASQEYGNIFNRAVDAHNLGLNQALGTHAVNYGMRRDEFDRLYEGARASHQVQQRDNELMNQRNFDAFLADFDIFERNRRRAGDYLFQGAGLGG